MTESNNTIQKWQILHLLIVRGEQGLTGNEARSGVNTPDGHTKAYFLNSVIPQLNKKLGFRICSKKITADKQNTTRYWIDTQEHAQRAIGLLQSIRKEHEQPLLAEATISQYLAQYESKAVA